MRVVMPPVQGRSESRKIGKPLTVRLEEPSELGIVLKIPQRHWLARPRNADSFRVLPPPCESPPVAEQLNRHLLERQPELLSSYQALAICMGSEFVGGPDQDISIEFEKADSIELTCEEQQRKEVHLGTPTVDRRQCLFF